MPAKKGDTRHRPPAAPQHTVMHVCTSAPLVDSFRGLSLQGKSSYTPAPLVDLIGGVGLQGESSYGSLPPRGPTSAQASRSSSQHLAESHPPPAASGSGFGGFDDAGAPVRYHLIRASCDRLPSHARHMQFLHRKLVHNLAAAAAAGRVHLAALGSGCRGSAKPGAPLQHLRLCRSVLLPQCKSTLPVTRNGSQGTDMGLAVDGMRRAGSNWRHESRHKLCRHRTCPCTAEQTPQKPVDPGDTWHNGEL